VIRLGYHPATHLQHGAGVDEALGDISAAGWDGFEWSPHGLAPYYADPLAFRARLDALGLDVSGIYCRCGFASDQEVAEWQKRVEAAVEFARRVGTQFIMLDGGSLQLSLTAATIDRIARLANAVGARAVSAGLTCTWHQHWGTLFQYPADFDALMAATDPALVRCTPDTAQMALGGFDLPATFEKYVSRMNYVHFKDLGPDRRFIELGRGTVQFGPLAKVLLGAGFDGWIIVDLDYTALDPRESSRVNLSYLQLKLGLKGRRRPAARP